MDLPACRTVVLTREPSDNSRLAARLAGSGLEVMEVPCTRTAYLDAPEPDGRFDAVAFLSRRGVAGFYRLPWAPRWLDGWHGLEPRPLIASVGSATSGALEEIGLEADLTASPSTGRALGEALAARLRPLRRVVVFRGLLQGQGLDEALLGSGVEPVSVAVYDSEPAPIPSLPPFAVAAVFVAAPSAAARLLERNPWLSTHPFVAIGATTESFLVSAGVANVVVAGTDIESQVEALTRSTMGR